MKQMLKILKFEYLNCVKNKAFIIVTVVLMAAVFLVVLIPGIISGMSSDGGADDEEGTKSIIAVNSSVYDDKTIRDEFSAFYPECDIKITDENIKSLKDNVNNGEYLFAVYIDEELSCSYITVNNSMFSESGRNLYDIIKNMYCIKYLGEHGIASDEAKKILNPAITQNTITTGTDQTKNFLPVYFLMCVSFMAVATYGQLVAQSVVTEKNTRAMELLITCAKPSHLIFGKVIGSGLAGLTQLTLIALTGIASVSSGPDAGINEFMSQYFNIPVLTVIYFLVFFIIGYFMVAFLLGALASFASKSEDLNTLISPVVLVLSVVYLVLIFMMQSEDLGGSVLNVLSYLPISGPLAMFVRVSLTNVEVWDICLSLVLQVVEVYLLGMLAAAIYKIGVLMYGNPPKLNEIIRLLNVQRKADKARKIG